MFGPFASSHQKSQDSFIGMSGNAKSSGGFSPNLVIAWPMNDGSGSSFASVGGTSNTETVQTGSLTWASNAGLPGTTATFSSTAYTAGANLTGANFTNTTPFSISVWTNMSATTAATNYTFVSTIGSSAGSTGFEFLMQGGGISAQPVLFLISNFGTGNYIQMSTTGSIGVSALHNVVVTYDGSGSGTNGVKFYIDGVATTSTVVHDALTASFNSGLPISLGGRTTGIDPINGILAYTAIYNSVLTPAQVSAYYAKGPRIN